MISKLIPYDKFKEAIVKLYPKEYTLTSIQLNSDKPYLSLSKEMQQEDGVTFYNENFRKYIPIEEIKRIFGVSFTPVHVSSIESVTPRLFKDAGNYGNILDKCDYFLCTDYMEYDYMYKLNENKEIETLSGNQFIEREIMFFLEKKDLVRLDALLDHLSIFCPKSRQIEILDTLDYLTIYGFVSVEDDVVILNKFECEVCGKQVGKGQFKGKHKNCCSNECSQIYEETTANVVKECFECGTKENLLEDITHNDFEKKETKLMCKDCHDKIKE